MPFLIVTVSVLRKVVNKMEEGKIHKIIQAKKQMTESSLVLWNARLETIIRTGNLERLVDALGTDVAGDGGCTGSGCPCKPPTDKCPIESGCGEVFIKEWLGEELFRSISEMANKQKVEK